VPRAVVRLSVLKLCISICSDQRAQGNFPAHAECSSAKKAQGVKLGGLDAKGIGNRAEAVERAEQLRPVFAELAGMSHRKMAAELNARQIPTPAGGQWHAVTVKRVLSRLA
jgi:hypothetical protein